MTSNVVIGVTSYNGAERLSWLLRSLWLRTPEIRSGQVSVVVVDDGSPRRDETRRMIEETKQCDEVRAGGAFSLLYLEHSANRGISAGWNTATRATDASLVVLINDDVIVSDKWLPPLVHILTHSPGVGCVGQNWHAFLREDVPELLRSKDSDRNVVPRDPVSKEQRPERRELEPCNPGRVMAPTGQLFAFRREDFNAIGGFDETYLSMYEESCFNTSMCADRRKIGVQLNWPFNWHQWSATFATNPELRASERLAASRTHYRKKWGVPEGTHEFEYTNPKHLGSIGDVDLEWLRPSGEVARGTLQTDGTYVDR